jgi:hypothetical protein
MCDFPVTFEQMKAAGDRDATAGIRGADHHDLRVRAGS